MSSREDQCWLKERVGWVSEELKRGVLLDTARILLEGIDLRSLSRLGFHTTLDGAIVVPTSARMINQ
jgi:hypothetical protein